MKIILKAIYSHDDGEPEKSGELPEGWSAVEAHVHTLEGAVNTFWQKDRLYRGAWRSQGWMGNLARIMSKTARLKAMLWRYDALQSTSEPVEDTLQDMINLAVFAKRNMEQMNQWGESA